MSAGGECAALEAISEYDDYRAFRFGSDVSGEPSKTSTFPQNRLQLIDVHAADDGRRIYDRVVVDVLQRLLLHLRPSIEEGEMFERNGSVLNALGVAAGRQFGDDLANEARELADVDLRFEGDGDDG